MSLLSMSWRTGVCPTYAKCACLSSTTLLAQRWTNCCWLSGPERYIDALGDELAAIVQSQQLPDLPALVPLYNRLQASVTQLTRQMRRSKKTFVVLGRSTSTDIDTFSKPNRPRQLQLVEQKTFDANIFALPSDKQPPFISGIAHDDHTNSVLFEDSDPSKI